MVPETPTDKLANYRLYHSGYYGNHLKFWSSVESFVTDFESGAWGADVPVALRLTATPGLSPPHYCSPTCPVDVKPLVERWVKECGINPAHIVLNEIGPDDGVTIQCEIMRSIRAYSMRYSHVKTIMRHAFPVQELHADGLAALDLLRRHMDAESYLNMHRLFDEFPDAVIEISVYDRPVGVLGLNSIFWEVRDY